jgi:hypothetical protein
MSAPILQAVLLLSLASIPSMSEEDKKAEAARLLQEGNDAFASGKHEEALDRYQRAYDTYASPKLYYSLARALDELGRHADAAHFYERFLIESGVEYRSALYERAHAKLRKASTGLGKLRLETTVPGATLFVDGVERATLPTTPLYLGEGRHELRAERDGFTAFESKVKIEPGKVTTVAVDMVPVRVVKEVLPKAAVCAPEVVPIETLKVVPPVEEESIVDQWWFWGIIGAAAAAAAVGTGVGIAMQSEAPPPERELGDTALSEWSRQ